MRIFKIAVLAGDGIGKEVMPEGLKILKSVAEKCDLKLEFHEFGWANCEYFLEHGAMMPSDWYDILKPFDAIYYGAVGWPELVPDHISLWGSLLQFRRKFDQYVNLRPVRLFPGVKSPLTNKEPGDIDFYVVRENTEGEYSAIGGKVYEGTDHELVIQESIFSKRGIDRILKYAFDLAERRPRKTLTSATKSNGLAISMPYWDERVVEVSKDYPTIKWDKQHIDILCARFVLQPERFDVVVASNLFGDILSDLGPACTGTMGLAPSANINPERNYPSLFEPVHGSAPDIYGKNIANPIAMIWSGAMMLSFFAELPGNENYKKAHDLIMKAIEQILLKGPHTKDMGGDASTQEIGAAILQIIKQY